MYIKIKLEKIDPLGDDKTMSVDQLVKIIKDSFKGASVVEYTPIDPDNFYTDYIYVPVKDT